MQTMIFYDPDKDTFTFDGVELEGYWCRMMALHGPDVLAKTLKWLIPFTKTNAVETIRIHRSPD